MLAANGFWQITGIGKGLRAEFVGKGLRPGRIQIADRHDLDPGQVAPGQHMIARKEPAPDQRDTNRHGTAPVTGSG